MQWLTNIYDPDRKDAKWLILTTSDETHEEAWERQQKWLSGKVIGLPQATEDYTVRELARIGMVGVYLP